MKVLFITGTDTNVGKTRVACALAAAWRRAGHRVAALKPIETGCAEGPNGLVGADSARLADASGKLSDSSLVGPIRLRAPASPEAAAALESCHIDLALVDRAAHLLGRDADLLLVEGAGGLLVPIDPATTMADLAARLRATLLVVARSSLGTINHTLLTLEAARRRSLPVLGVVLNQLSPVPGADEMTNPDAIARHGAVRVFGTLPYRPGDPSNDDLALLAETHLDLAGLWQSMQ